MSEIQFYNNDWEVSDALQAFYTPYASYVIQTRALPDARDGLKTGARFILYSQYKDKLTFKNKRRKAVATVNAAMRFSPHGDASILGTAVRLSQDFSLRYPIIEVQGNNGSYLAGDDYSQARYLEMRGNEIAYDMTYLLEKDTIDTWKMNYTNEEEYPTVLPSKFPYALVNGSFGIGVACSSSIPPHNIKDVCAAAITLLKNPEADFEDIYCPIDFPTGGTIINENEVKESLKNGCGKAALIRASIDYDEKENEIIVYEMPYMTFTNNAMASINKGIEDGLLLGIESVIDGTDFNGPRIYIKLNKGVNVKKIIKMLYKHTILQNSFSINMNMLEDGLKPKLYGWKEQLQTYLNHLRMIIVKSYNYDLRKLLDRIHILNGLILAFYNIEELVKDIRSSKNTAEAKIKLTSNYELDDIQAEAILKMRLSSLTHLEIEKLEKEKNEKTIEANRIKEILSSEEKIKEEIEKDINNIAKKYGDERKTKNISLDFSSENEEEPIERKELLIHFTNLNNIYTQESTTLIAKRRGGVGSKIKLKDNETVIQTLSDDNFGSILAFSNQGKMYSIPTDDLPVNAKINTAQLFELSPGEKLTTLTSISRRQSIDYFVFITKNGMIKKTAAAEYDKKRGKSLKAINLKDDDEVVAVHFIKDEPIGILTSQGNFVIINTNEINAIGRATAGVKGIKLNDGDSVIASHIISGKYLITATANGLVKKADLSEFPTCNRGIKGKKISGTRENDEVINFLTLNEDCDIIFISTKGLLKFNTSELRTLSREATGVKAMKVPDGSKIVDLVKA